MALITTAAAGNWSNTATWTGGVLPAATDDIQIDHALTVDGTVRGPTRYEYSKWKESEIDITRIHRIRPATKTDCLE